MPSTALSTAEAEAVEMLSTLAPAQNLVLTPAPETANDTAALIVDLLQFGLTAPDVSSAVMPMLDSLVDRTAAVGSAYFQQANGAVFTARAASGAMPQGELMELILTHGLPNETPLIQALMQSKGAIFFDDTSMAYEATGFPELGVVSLAAAPVHNANGDFLGAFLMHTFMRHSWSSQEQQIFTAISRIMAQLTARLIAEERTLQAHEDALRALGLALEYRDAETKGHTDRVTELALYMGTQLQLSDEELTALRWGAYLHDIGKIGTPDKILHKPGPLNDEEWQIMRQHPRIGELFSTELSFLPERTRTVIRSHHERWDGRGYPDGLVGENIPLTARIFSICDTYDALTSIRPYKKAWSSEDALNEIKKNAGTQFDPSLILYFEQALGQLKSEE